MTSSKPETEAYPEHDKLGPLGRRPSALHDPVELRSKLAGEFHAAVADAREAAAEVEQGSSKAVHDSRKALRRARAALSMMSAALPRSEWRAVRTALQEARRSLSMVRDHAVAPETLGGLSLSDAARETARRVLDNAAEAIPPIAEIKKLLGDAAARAAAQAEAIEAALPSELSWEDAVEGIAEIYGQARRARRLAKHSRAWFHTWRRRSKELVYQLDFVSRHAGARTLAVRAELDSVTDLLGPAVDLIMLREFVETHAQGLAPAAIHELRDELDGQLDDLMKEGRRAGRDAYRQKPKKFARRLAKAVKRDLTPVDDADHHQNDEPDAD